MKHLVLNKKILQALLVCILVFGSALSLGDEYLQDAVFEDLQKVGVDTESLKNKLNEGDFSGAKALLEEEKDKTSLSDVEEEVANLIARKMVTKVRQPKEERQEPVYTDPEPQTLRNGPVEKVVLDEEEGKKEIPQLRNQVSHNYPIPGDAVASYSGIQKAIGRESLEIAPSVDVAPRIDKEALLNIGVRESLPGMSIFRLLKVHVKVWARRNRTATSISQNGTTIPYVATITLVEPR